MVLIFITYSFFPFYVEFKLLPGPYAIKLNIYKNFIESESHRGDRR